MITLLDHGAHRSRCHVALAVLASAALAAVSCSDSNLPTTPTTFGVAGSSSSSSSNVSINALVDNIVAQPIARPFCPTVSPFTVPFTVVVNPNGATGVVVTSLTMQFTDIAGTHLPSITIPAPVPIQEFGTELTNARDLRFPLSMGIGCGVGRSGVIVVSFDATDQRGKKSSGQTKITVQ
jgi:hypothetical protein